MPKTPPTMWACSAPAAAIHDSARLTAAFLAQAGTVNVMSNLPDEWCPASNALGDFRTCPGCGRAVTPTASGPRMPRHKLPEAVTHTDAQQRLDAAWAAINRTQTHLAATRRPRR